MKSGFGKKHNSSPAMAIYVDSLYFWLGLLNAIFRVFSVDHLCFLM